MRIEVLGEAEQDLLDGFRFYEAQQAGLGDYFLVSLFSDIESLLHFAGIHERHFGYHRLLSKRFPYAVYYRFDSATEIIGVYAVLDCRQSPVASRNRLQPD